MGFSVSYAVFRGLPSDEFLSRLSLREGGRTNSPLEEGLAGGVLPSGWYLMVSNDPLMFADPDRHTPIAIGAESVTAVVLETTMSFYVFGFRNAEPVWSVVYDTQEHPEHVKVSGVYPEEWKAIGERLVTQADACDPEPLGEDLLADAPIDLFAAMTGFRHDRPHQAFERNARVLVAR